ncbi:pentatricopeptide repeat-containing protein At5g08305-like [Dioscorea cayenensis subsp. rotundata]|uniref:Pentatricopeptide repeat-containing protein At5g08305-like n=1 Tax=Dioscorea cayennensis subsp. rotundata TaxID=55577 RepID=A0AB40BNX9_DIOCR|nr:pentatricopeptide repeat-containing protein At5g08305-like [Dioscorea cayenensis subsp. rotundata]
MKELNQIHAQATISGHSSDNYIISKLLLFSTTSGPQTTDYSFKLFSTVSNPGSFFYSTIIRAFSTSKNPAHSFSLYNQMLLAGISPDHFSFPFLTKACARLASLPLGTSLHCDIVKYGFSSDLFVQNSLIHMYASCRDIVSARGVFDAMCVRNLVSWNTMVDGYAKCGDLVAARNVFDGMPVRDVVSWSALIDGYVKGGEFREALAVFASMCDDGMKVNAVTMVSVLCACAHLGALDLGRRMHRYIKDNGMRLTIQLSTSLVDMYAKCGSITEALAVFREVPVVETDVLIWNAIIGGLAMHGRSKDSLALFEEMQATGRVQPDEITYLCLLSACTHGGLVEDARRFFNLLKAQRMAVQVEHYACMVDVLGRSGRVEEAYEIVRTMPMQPSASVLGALLTACQTHGHLHLGELVGQMLIELDPDHDGRYIGLSSVYASAKQWDDAKTTREVMERRGVRKTPGYSAVEVDGSLHRFIAHDKMHQQTTDVYSMLSFLLNQMKLESDIINGEQFKQEIWENV